MASVALQTTLDQIDAQLAAMSKAPKPSYSIDGESFSWGEHWNNLITRRLDIEQALQRSDGPFQIDSMGVA